MENTLTAPTHFSAREFFPHLLSLVIPLLTTVYFLGAPHQWYVSLLFIAPLFLVLQLDLLWGAEKKQPATDMPAWPFDLLVYVLALIHFFNIYLVAKCFETQGLFSFDFFPGVFLIAGSSAGFSIITAHELIHRRGWERQLGRLLLASVMYEHFYTEHIRGHHVRVGTPEDPATARYGERFRDFFFRTVPAQFKSAWRLECSRLGDQDMPWYDSRQLKNRVFHGVLTGWTIAFTIMAVFGFTAFIVFLVQSVLAFRLLEVVNYFEHWGLSRSSDRGRVQPMDSWDTHSRFTYYGLIGLSRHADHHAYSSRPYQDLRVWDEAPILPRGYVSIVPMILTNNDEFIAYAKSELKRKGLGPFRDQDFKDDSFDPAEISMPDSDHATPNPV